MPVESPSGKRRVGPSAGSTGGGRLQYPLSALNYHHHTDTHTLSRAQTHTHARAGGRPRRDGAVVLSHAHPFFSFVCRSAATPRCHDHNALIASTAIAIFITATALLRRHWREGPGPGPRGAGSHGAGAAAPRVGRPGGWRTSAASASPLRSLRGGKTDDDGGTGLVAGRSGRTKAAAPKQAGRRRRQAGRRKPSGAGPTTR